jgi:signal transduction histidine kinase
VAGFVRPPASIRNRLVAIFAVSAGVLLVLTCALLYIAFDAQLDGTIDQTLRDRAAEVTLDLHEGNVHIRAGEPFGVLLDPESGAVIDSTAAASRRSPVLSRRELARAREGQIVVDRRRVTGLGERGRVLARPETTAEGEQVVVVVGESLDAVARARQRLGLLLGIVSPLLIGAIAGCGWVLAGAALRPVQRMTEEAEAISLLESGQRLKQPPGDDEIAHLGHTLNAMLDRIEASLARERAFVDDASHELRTPLSILRGELELACDGPVSRAEMKRTLESALQEADQLGRLTEDLLTLARADSGRLAARAGDVALLAATRQAVRRYRQPADPDVDVVGGEVTVRADPVLLEPLLRNVITNACRHAAGRVQLAITLDGGWAVLTVADDGAGFPPAFLPVAFDRFSRADADRGRDHGGSGLGLAIVAAVVHAQHGQVQVGNGAPLGGGRIEVRLPIAGTAVDSHHHLIDDRVE